MARGTGPEASDDSISITSTVESEKKEDYEVECILAEKKSKGAVKYLTAWKGYPETEHDWLPRENFSEGDAFSKWTATKKSVAKREQKPFDVKAWKQRCKAIKLETSSRKERRRIKRLQLVERDKLTAVVGEQDDDIQSCGSDPTPKRSNKLIKRRSVHQDSPPSSPSSVPPSSSSSEDSDRPLMSRQESETFPPITKWTQAQTIALEEGLRTLKGPRWREILSLYGRNGTINQVLSDKTPSDLYDKAKSVRQEFVDSGREPPEYLKPFSKPASTGTTTPNIYSESTGHSRALSRSRTSSRSTSADSLMAELHDRQSIRKAKNQMMSRAQQNENLTDLLSSARGQEKASHSVYESLELQAAQAAQAPDQQAKIPAAEKSHKENPKAAQKTPYPRKSASPAEGTAGVQKFSDNHLHRDEQPETEPRAREPPLMSSCSLIDRQSTMQTPSAKEGAKSATNATTQPELPGANLPENDKTARDEVAQTKWSGTARVQTARPSVAKSTRSEGAGIGPTRPSSSKLKPKLGQIEPKKPMVTGDVTAAWNAEPKKRMSNNWATKNADPVDGQPPVRKYKLSVQNRIYKSRRDGRVPDPSRLLFIDPKTGKAPITVPAASATAVPSKTPLQLHQELAAREEEEHLVLEGIAAEKREEPLVQKVEDTTATSKTEVDPIRISDQTPLNAPRGPRIETKRLNTMSLQDYTKRSTSLTQSSQAVVNPYRPYSSNGNPHQPYSSDGVKPHRSYSSDGVSLFALRAYPSLEHKSEISTIPEKKAVIGHIKVNGDDQDGIAVRLLGFDWDIKTLLLTIKSPPRTVNFVFKTVCLASEYKAYFPAVSPYFRCKGIC